MLDNILNILKEGKNQIFYQIGKDKITYQECYKEVKELSENLRKQGNSPVIVYGHKNINQMISILSCVVAKRCYIPIDIYTPISRIEEIIKQSNSKLILKNESLNIETIECLSLNELNQKYQNKIDFFPPNNTYAYIIFTSGSTGLSKGVPITYDNLESFIQWITTRKEFENCNSLNVLSQASFSFDLTVMDIYFSIYKNCSITAISKETKEDLSAIYQTLKNNHINFLIMTPTFIKMLLIDPNFNQENYQELRYMFFCGECLEVESVKKIKDKFPKISIINAYGPTEATCCVSLIKIEDAMLDNKLIPVGKISTSAVNIQVEQNEIILKGNTVFSNYLNQTSDNCYQENGINCYKTGDLGEIKEDYLYCLGRSDSQIKYQGYRIELGDIENNLLKIDGIKEAVVICKYKENTNIVRLIKAFVTTNKDITEQFIKQKLSHFLPNYMIPKKIIILEKMPLNNNGKYDRKKLKEL